MLDPKILKKDFPILQRPMNGKPLVYLDNASTTQKPQGVLDELNRYYTSLNANIHRGVYELSEKSTEAYEGTRAHVAKFINAADSAEIIFTRNATEAINLVAYTWGEQNIGDGDVVVVSGLEHHSNLVPWQELARRKKAELRVIPVKDDGTLDLNTLESLIDKKVKLVAISQMSNVVGTITPLPKIIAAARAVGARVLVDGAQGVPHLGADVQKLDCDFLAFSSHKMFGPTGVGVLYGKREFLESMPPFLFGGDMVRDVNLERATWNEVPWKFEAGTPNIADVIAFDKALSYVEAIGFEAIMEHDQKLFQYARKKLAEFPKLTMYGPTDPFATSIVSFTIEGVHPHDIGSILGEEGVAIRTGHHCCQPLMQRFSIPATARMSFALYNSEEDIDFACAALKKVYEIFKL